VALDRFVEAQHLALDSHPAAPLRGERLPQQLGGEGSLKARHGLFVVVSVAEVVLNDLRQLSRHRVQSEGRLAARLGTEDFDEPPARQTAAAQGDVQAQGAGRYPLHIRRRALAQLHDRALAELLLDLERSPTPDPPQAAFCKAVHGYDPFPWQIRVASHQRPLPGRGESE
jgi:hypothetical protein